MKFTHLKPEEFIVHNDKEIRGFFLQYRWLSNFWVCPVEWQGIIYPSSENAYQAAKVRQSDRGWFIGCSPAESKQRKFPMQWDVEVWNGIRLQVMEKIVFDKFLRNLDLREKLINTGEAFLEESLTWKDLFWGYDVNLKKGQNNLGRILMATREYFKLAPQ